VDAVGVSLLIKSVLIFTVTGAMPEYFWAGAYYRQQKAKGCWQDRTPYDELTYLEALRRRGSPLLGQLGAVVKTA
jgi:hypothetical protein